MEQKPAQQNHVSSNDRDRLQAPEASRMLDRERDDSAIPSYVQGLREAPPPQPPITQSETKTWGYPGIEMMNTGAAFWQNYSGTINEYFLK